MIIKSLGYTFLISAFSMMATFSTHAQSTKPTLTVYTYDSFTAYWGPGPAIKKAFEAQCDCELKFVALSDGVSLLNRLRMEGSKSKADIILGLDNNLIHSAKETGLFAQSNIDTSTLTLPEKWSDDTFVPYDYGYFAFIYDKNRIANPPKSMAQLLDSKENWKIIYQDPRTSTPGLGLMLWMQSLYPENNATEWKKLANKTLTVTKGWSESYGLFLKGEGDFVLSYTSSPGYHILMDKKDNYAAAIFDEGHYLQVEVAAQLKSSQQPELAQQFMKFMLTPEFQETIPTTNWMYPVIDIPLPEVYSLMPKPEKSRQFDADVVAKERQQWTRNWQSAVSR